MTHLDQRLRNEGTYLCPSRSIERPRAEKGDASVVRCTQDSLSVSSASGQIVWKRVFFQKEDCIGDSLGFAEWSTPFQKGRVGAPENVTLTRVDPDWYFDQVGGCDLRNIPMRTKWSITGLNCRKLLPKNFSELASLYFDSKGREGASQVTGTWDKAPVTCTR